ALMLSLSTVTQAQPPAPVPAVAVTTVKGKVVRIAPTNDFFVVQTTDGRQVTLYPNDKTTYWRGTQTVQFRELRPDIPVTVVYDVRDKRNIVNKVTWVDGAAPAAAAPPPPAAPAGAGTTLEGTIVRLEGTDQFIVRTADGKEMILYAQPQTTYKIEDRVVQF